MDALLSNIMGEAIERPTDITVAETTQPDKAPLSSKDKKKDVPSRHFTFIFWDSNLCTRIHMYLFT